MIDKDKTLIYIRKQKEAKMQKMTVPQYAAKIKRSKARVYMLLQAGRIPGAVVDDSGNWEIPKGAIPQLRRQGRKVSRRSANAATKS